MNLTVYQCICHLCMADFCKLLMGGCPPSPPQGKAQICAKRVNKNELCWGKKKNKQKKKNILIINVLFTTLYEVQINKMPNESIIKSVLFSSFCTI